MTGKSKGKKKTTSKSSKGVGKGKASLAKMTKAANKCCPVIRWKCEEVPGKKVKTLKLAAYTDSDGHSYPAEYKMVAGPARTRCKVRLGSGKPKVNLAPAEKDDYINKLKDGLAAKRCVSVLDSY